MSDTFNPFKNRGTFRLKGRSGADLWRPGFYQIEQDFIINYDIKYRMGQESGEDEGE